MKDILRAGGTRSGLEGFMILWDSVIRPSPASKLCDQREPTDSPVFRFLAIKSHAEKRRANRRKSKTEPVSQEKRCHPKPTIQMSTIR